ncbi:MAG: thioesterase II family protein [Burkholderiales bacterium]
MADLTTWLPYLKPRPNARIRLFCFPQGCGSASLFAHWPLLLPDWLDVCAVQLPGRENRMKEDPIDRMDLLVTAIHSALEPLLDKPFALFGHSMGGSIAYEWLKRMKNKEKLVHFFPSASPPPHIPDDEQTHKMSNEELVQHAKESGGFAPELLDFPELLEMYLPILKADGAITETYRPVDKPELTCPITAFAGDQDEIVPAIEVREWDRYTKKQFTLHTYNGGHFFLPARKNEITAVLTQVLL